MHTASKILGANGQPYRNGHAQNGNARATRQDLLDLIAKTYDDRARKRRAQAAGGDIHAKYDAAQSSPDFDNYWASADAHDADSANSKNVRARLVQCSRGYRWKCWHSISPRCYTRPSPNPTSKQHTRAPL